MIELLFVGVALTLLMATCAAVYQATKQKYVLALQARESHTDMLEDELRLLRAEVRRLSSRPPPPLVTPPPVVAPPPVSVPFSAPLPPLDVPRVPFMSRGSLVPPPPEYLFELPKKVLDAPVFPAAPLPEAELDWDEPPPSTLKSDQCERIARSLRPPAP